MLQSFLDSEGLEVPGDMMSSKPLSALTRDFPGRENFEDQESSLSGSLRSSPLADNDLKYDSVPDDSEEDERYDFRQTVRAKQPLFVPTWVDCDDTGDFDPNGKRRKDVERNDLKRKHRDTENGEDELFVDLPAARPKRHRNFRSGRHNGDRYIIKLPFVSNWGRSQMRNFPFGESLLHDEVSKHTSEVQGVSMKRDLCGSETNRRRRLRNRRDNNVHEEDVIQLDLTGHPAARGCRACYNLGLDCTLALPAQVYPCELCIKDMVDCEPLVPPKHKRACEHCKKRKLRCSYLQSQNHDSPCQACAQYGFHCVAGPLLDPKRTRLTEDGKPGTIHHSKPSTRNAQKEISDNAALKSNVLAIGLENSTIPHASITLKRDLKSADDEKYNEHERMSSKLDEASSYAFGRYDHSTCRVTSKHPGPDGITVGEKCSDTWGTRNMRKNETLTPKLPPLLQKEPRQPKSRETSGLIGIGYRIRKILTRLLHPVTCNYVNRTGAKSCHWCNDPFYGLFGVGVERMVKVIEHVDGVYDEFSSEAIGPHAEPSRCCHECTTKRVRVVCCPGHQLRRIPMPIAYRPDWEATLKELSATEAGSKREELLNKFCSICPDLAVYWCVRPEGTLKDSNCSTPHLIQTISGCGLRLCKVCADNLMTIYNMSLSQMVESISIKPSKKWPIGLRADYDFFQESGFMMRQVLRGLEAAP